MDPNMQEDFQIYISAPLNTQSMTSSLDEFQVMLKKTPNWCHRFIWKFETWLKNNKYLLVFVTKSGYSFIHWFTLDRKNPKQY